MSVSLRLPDDIAERLAALARRTGRSKTFYMIEAIREHIGDLEDVYLAETRLTEIKSGKAGTIAFDDLLKRYGVDD